MVYRRPQARLAIRLTTRTVNLPRWIELDVQSRYGHNPRISLGKRHWTSLQLLKQAVNHSGYVNSLYIMMRRLPNHTQGCVRVHISHIEGVKLSSLHYMHCISD
jgi:hypothetical protein